MTLLSIGSFFNDIFGTGRNIDNVAFQLFGRNIYWYGIIIAVGVLAGFFLATLDAKRRKLPGDLSTDMVIWAMIFAIVFARLYYVIFDPDHHFKTIADIFRISDGGLAIYGGIIGGVLGLFICSRIRKQKLSLLFDIAAPCLAIGQAFGRWGNFMNQEAFGNAVTDKALQWFPYAVYFNSPKGANPVTGAAFEAGWYQATFFYESFWCLLICIFLIIYRKRQRFSGELALWYFLLYGIERAFVELLRQDQLKLWNSGLPVSSVLSAILVIVSGVLLILGHVYARRGKLAPCTPGSIYYKEPENSAGVGEAASEESKPLKETADNAACAESDGSATSESSDTDDAKASDDDKSIPKEESDGQNKSEDDI